MKVTETYRTYVLEQLAPLIPIRAKNMFGGVGLYADDVFFALIAGDTLYFKVDDTNRTDYESAGMTPFAPYGDSSRTMQYYTVPAEVLEDRELLRLWVEKALSVAINAQERKRKRRR